LTGTDRGVKRFGFWAVYIAKNISFWRRGLAEKLITASGHIAANGHQGTSHEEEGDDDSLVDAVQVHLINLRTGATRAEVNTRKCFDQETLACRLISIADWLASQKQSKIKDGKWQIVGFVQRSIDSNQYLNLVSFSPGFSEMERWSTIHGNV